MENFHLQLREELRNRTAGNPRYSLRSFARHLKVDPSHLARVLQGKRQVSERYVEWAGQALHWAPEKIQSARQAPDVSKSRSGRKIRVSPEKRFTSLAPDELLISRWIHFVILEMTELSGFKATVLTLSERLGLSVGVVADGVERLLRVGALVETPNGLRLVKNFTTTRTPGTSAGLKKIQKEILTAAGRAIDDFLPEERDQSGITMAVDSRKLPEAKERIKRFRRELMEFLQEGERDRVYQLSVSLFPAERGKL